MSRFSHDRGGVLRQETGYAKTRRVSGQTGESWSPCKWLKQTSGLKLLGRALVKAEQKVGVPAPPGVSRPKWTIYITQGWGIALGQGVVAGILSPRTPHCTRASSWPASSARQDGDVGRGSIWVFIWPFLRKWLLSQT